MPAARPGHAPHVIVVELLGWWVVAVGVWMASLSAWSGEELLVAAGCAVPCALAAVGARRAIGGAWRAPGQAVRWLLLLPAAIVIDAARVLTWPVRSRTGGSFRTVDIRARGGAPAAGGLRAAASFALSSTPASYVVAADERAGTLTVHGLGGSSMLERSVSR
jgi:hypothetical protein